MTEPKNEKYLGSILIIEDDDLQPDYRARAVGASQMMGRSIRQQNLMGLLQIMSANPALNPAQVRSALMSSARAFPTTGADPGTPMCVAPTDTDQLECYCTTATCGAGMLDAGEIVIWTDVDGVLSADPRLVPEAQVIEALSYNEAMELAYFGAKVIHPQTMAPAVQKRIPIWIRNTFNPRHPGTVITSQSRSALQVKGITSIENIALVNLEARPCPAGAMDVVLGPGWPGILLHEAIGHGLEGDFNRKGSSAFNGKIGKRVAALLAWADAWQLASPPEQARLRTRIEPLRSHSGYRRRLRLEQAQRQLAWAERSGKATGRPGIR